MISANENVKGIAIGNGFIDPKLQLKSLETYAIYHNLFPDVLKF